MLEPISISQPTGGEQPPAVVPQLVEGQEGSLDTNEQIGEAAVGSATQIPVTEGPDTSWDYTKAETVGTAVREEARDKGSATNPDLFDKTQIQEIAASHRRKEPDSWLVDRHKKELQRLETEARWNDGKKNPEDLAIDIEETQKDLDWALQNELDPTGKRIEHAEQERHKKIEKIEQVYEQLYDLNPELFAQMPTSEFMQILPEFKTVMEEAHHAEWSEQRMNRLQTELDHIVSQRRTLTSVELRIASDIAGALALGDEDTKKGIRLEVYRKFSAIDNADNYDTTPNQINQKKLEIIREYLEPIAKKRQEAEQRKEEFMAKYAKNSDANPPAESTEGPPQETAA